MASPLTAILVAAGRSRRMGSDKLWEDIWGRPAWRWSLDTLLAVPAIERIAIAVGADAVEHFTDVLPGESERCLVVPGGEVRADSVIAGVWALTGVGYDDETLASWADWMTGEHERGHDVFAYFNNDVGGHAPRDAIRLRERLALQPCAH